MGIFADATLSPKEAVSDTALTPTGGLRMKSHAIAGLVVLVMFIFSAGLHAETGVITVDIVAGTVDPPNPIVNVAAADAIVIKLVKGGKVINSFDYNIQTTISAGRTLGGDSKGAISARFADPVFHQGTIVINTKRCGWNETKKDLNGYTGSGAVPCPVLLVTDSGYTTLYGESNTISVSVRVFERGAKSPARLGKSPAQTFSWSDDNANEEMAQLETAAATEPLERYEVPFSIQLVARGSHLFWSLGMNFFDVRDEVYALTPSSTDTDKSEIVSAGNGEVNYQIGANAHYSLSITRRPWSHASLLFGLSTNVPVDQLSAYAGLAFTAWTLPSNDSGHIFLALGYTKAAKLAPEFRTTSLVPSSTAVTSLTRDEYDFGVVVGVSFSFFGGQDQFKAVFPGKKSGGTAEESNE